MGQDRQEASEANAQFGGFGWHASACTLELAGKVDIQKRNL
jgi:hypothetical protein